MALTFVLRFVVVWVALLDLSLSTGTVYVMPGLLAGVDHLVILPTHGLLTPDNEVRPASTY